ncbi:HAMP domain-containing histidine kinase [Pedobacter sp. MC2016-14]|uniref:sensor histidine kinase n=1 Tax=Pedobacter sp. MC2016-14 TaxID=2897327 RepID=UPI001E60C3AB|nr:HAMP domain-containing sensor histidine kinase [Pedobacter sp. MC2016-14]MCD0487824.1 HAMP domain-containing histidine kinase [Pedobacter sp. MC2016-14]
MSKLLDKPLKAFVTYALVVLLCSIPVYFLIIDWIWVHEINKHNQIVADSTKKNLLSLQSNGAMLKSAIKLWNSLQPAAKIQEVKTLKNDSTYSTYRKDRSASYKGYDRFEGLVTYFRINGKAYRLTVESNVEESYETIIAITAITILFFIILLVGFIKLNKRISLKLWKPFYMTLAKVKDFDLTANKEIEFEKSNVLEFEELNLSINKFIDNSVATFRQQKEFTENASHELQTPLAIIQSKLDLLLQDESITTRQSQIIEETNNALSRVSRINKNLLLLAKIENQQFLEEEPLNISELLKEILHSLMDLLGEKRVLSQLDKACFVNGNAILIEIMLTNLLMNAWRHTDGEAEIFISISGAELIVANTGSHALDAEKLFRRFSTSSTHTPGSGLGLSIVKEICKRYGWEIRYGFLEEMHRFTVRF